MRRGKDNTLSEDAQERHDNRMATKAEGHAKKKVKAFVKKLRGELKRKFRGYEQGESGSHGGSDVNSVLDNLLAESSWW